MRKEVNASGMNDYTEGNPSAAINLEIMDLQWFAEDGGGDPGTGEAGAGDAGGEPTGQNPEGTEGNSGEDGQQGEGAAPQKPGWLAGVKSDLRDHEALTHFGTVSDLVGSYLELTQKADGSIKIPGDDASKDEVKAYREAMGIPEKAEDYQIQVPEGGIGDQEYLDSMKRQAHELGLSQTQAQAFYEKQSQSFTSYIEQAKKEQQQAVEKVTEEMKRELGDNYKPRMQAAQRVVKSVMGEEFSQYLDESGLGNDARMIRAMIKLSDVISEDALPHGKAAGTPAKKDWSFDLPDDL
jgi:hypothetical protein